jgi:NAD(P)-dependent dehydrogenase (short-subunit alcohol dehydrogenase family)
MGTIDTLGDEGWTRSLELGLMSAVRCTRAALPWLRKAEWGRIVNVSAHSTKRQTPTLIGYTAAKAALTSMSKNLAKTLAKEKILVNTVSPGTFLSGGVKTWLQGMAKQRGIDPNSLEDLNRIIAEDFHEPSDLGRAGLPDEIGAVIAFLASRRNSYMTGANVNVDGGSDFV